MTTAEIAQRFDAKRCGEDWKANCPAHEDREPTLNIREAPDGRTLIKCHAGCDTSDVLALRGLTFKDLFPAKPSVWSHAWEGNGSEWSPKRQSRPVAAFDWKKSVDALTEKQIEAIAEWRGFSFEFIRELRAVGKIGLCDNKVAFAVHSGNKIVGAHVRVSSDKWIHVPNGIKAAPMVFGELVPGDRVNVFESTWDGLAYLDKSKERHGVLITRGSANWKLATDLAPQNFTLFLWSQNDAAGEKWERDICMNTKCTVKRVKIPEQYKDLNDWTLAGATVEDLVEAMAKAEMLREAAKPLIEFRSPLQLKNFVPPPGIVLIGDCHVVKGSVFVVGGAPGVGKSRASVALAEAGATGHEWFGLPVHRKFKTMVVQTENGEFRLAREFGELDCDALENFVRVCPPPPYGLCFGRDGFREQLAAAVAGFAPDVLLYDPWNAAAREQDSREYLDTFDALRSVLPFGDDAPALGIVAHTRKPKHEERTSGRALLNLLAGSYVLGSVPRSAFVMQAASDETTDNRIVWTCCKNNDGELGPRSAWERRSGLFAPVHDFDWETFDAPEKDRRELLTEADVRSIFKNGALTLTEAAKQLEDNTGAHRATCYRALSPEGRFAKHLCFKGERINWE